MDHDFWHARWHSGEIGFHRLAVHWALELHWPRLAQSAADGVGVLVPLCGKSLDMLWLAECGHRVQGVELSRKAIAEFFAEAGRVPEQQARGELTGWTSGPIELFEGDFFAFEPDSPSPLFYDRAALVALPESMRQAYLVKLRRVLADEAQGLLVTLESDPARSDGPPFDVLEFELHRSPGLEFDLLERRKLVNEPARPVKPNAAPRYESAWRVRAC